jgi:hypothetical protein
MNAVDWRREQQKATKANHMKKAITILMATFAFAGFILAGETTLKGKGVCAKCTLGETDKCQPALQVTKGGKTETYYVDGSAGKELHRFVCQAPKDGVLVTGSVREKDGRKWITGKLLAPRE